MRETTDHETVRVTLLGGFRAERVGAASLACAWPRRSAKTLTKLLATCRSHALHREQIVETLWPDVDLDSALNSFGKALHAARHALEPELPPRCGSHYLRLTDGMVALETDTVAIDADRFERLAGVALRGREIEAYEAALAVYGGELLPEDRYEDWCSERRASLAELRVRLLLGVADALEERGACTEAADRLRQIVSEDPTREEVHRRLIRIWAGMGNRDQAVRQFHVCQEALRRDLDLVPQPETLALYQDILAGRMSAKPAEGEQVAVTSPRPVARAGARSRPLVGRDGALEHLLSLLERDEGRPPMVLLTGEAGVGKTRLLEALAEAAAATATVLRGEVGAHVSHLPYGPVAVALDAFVAGRAESERRELVRRHPPLARLVPSLALNAPVRAAADVDHVDLLFAAIRAIHELSGTRPLLFVFDDLHEADPLSLDVLRYLAHLARRRPWLIVGAVREEELQAEGAIAWRLESMRRERLCAKRELTCLASAEAHELVSALWDTEPVEAGLAGEICARAGGNPLFIEALVEEARRRREPYLGDACRSLSRQAESAVPPRVRFLVSTQTRALNDGARRLLGLAAAAGAAEFSLEDLLGASARLETPIPPAAVFDALDQALAYRILEERPGGYAFRHRVVRSAVCQELSRHRREELQAAWREGDSTRRLRLTASR